MFHDAYTVMPGKFTNVTNGIAHRRWLCQSNPGLTAFIRERIGDGFVLHAEELEKLKPYASDKASLDGFMAIKRQNKERLADYIRRANGVVIDPESLFDIQVKRLHEYKRQHLNALHILHTYLTLKDNPNMAFTPAPISSARNPPRGIIWPRKSSGSSATWPGKSTPTRRSGIS